MCKEVEEERIDLTFSVTREEGRIIKEMLSVMRSGGKDILPVEKASAGSNRNFIADMIRLSGNSAIKIASVLGIDYENLSRFVKGEKGSVAPRKVNELMSFLGLTMEVKLREGIHVWRILALPEDMASLSSTLSILLPEERTIVPLRGEREPSCYRYAIFSNGSPGIRIFLTVSMVLKNRTNVYPALSDFGNGAKWIKGANGKSDASSEKGLILSSGQIESLCLLTEDVSVSEFDEMLGIDKISLTQKRGSK